MRACSRWRRCSQGTIDDHERGVFARLLVRDAVRLLAREVVALDPLAHGPVEELEAGGDEPLDAPAVEPGEAGELFLVGEVERRDDEREHLRVLVPDPVARGRRQPELPAEPAQQLRRAGEPRAELVVGLVERGRLGQEESET